MYGSTALFLPERMLDLWNSFQVGALRTTVGALFIAIRSVESYDWSQIDSFTVDEKKSLILSAAGSFVGAFVLGVRDRHRDNMMISDKAEFFHIDFGFGSYKAFIPCISYAIAICSILERGLTAIVSLFRASCDRRSRSIWTNSTAL